MINPLSNICRSLLLSGVHDFEVASTVEIPLLPGECPETRAEDLRRWCGQNSLGRWKPVERWTKRGVRIAFESITDAVNFRMAN